MKTQITILAATLCTLNTLAYTQVINEQFKLLANDGNASDLFGSAVAVNNAIIAVGAYSDWDNNVESGSVYLFNTYSGTHIRKLLASDADRSDRFGEAIAIENNIIAVGAWGNDDNGTYSGSVYLFNALTGSELFKLVPSDNAVYDAFGASVAIEDNVVAVGSVNNNTPNGYRSGAVYLYDATTGTQTAKLIPNDGIAESRFGKSVAISNGILAAGAWHDDDNGAGSGSAYLFDLTTGLQTFKLVPDDGNPEDYFGEVIDIDNGIVVVGAQWSDPNGSRSGSAYLFDASTGMQLFKLLPDDNAPNDAFGSSVAIENGVVAVGAKGDDDNSSSSGSVYLFDVATGKQTAKLLASDGNYGDEFGGATAMHDGYLVSGAMKNDDLGNESGSAYIFRISATVCPADLNDDNQLNFFDVSAFLNAYNAQDPIADFDGNGEFNFFDVSAFLNAFNAGCP